MVSCCIPSKLMVEDLWGRILFIRQPISVYVDRLVTQCMFFELHLFCRWTKRKTCIAIRYHYMSITETFFLLNLVSV